MGTTSPLKSPAACLLAGLKRWQHITASSTHTSKLAVGTRGRNGIMTTVQYAVQEMLQVRMHAREKPDGAHSKRGTQ